MLTVLASTCLATANPAALLHANRAAMRAPVVGTLVQSYRYRSERMAGSASSVSDLATGRYVERHQAGLSTGAEGFDGQIPSMRDLSRFYSPQEGGNKRALAVNRAYRNANLWWSANQRRATVRPIDCNSIEVTPKGGEPFRAAFDPATHLLSSVIEQYVYGHTRAIHYADYRPCGLTLVPGRIEIVDDEDVATTQTLELDKCALAQPRNQSAYAIPRQEPQDWSLPPSGRAVLPIRPHDNEVMVRVRINGRGPYIFYLDTGGHNIVSPRLAKELGLKVEGAGRSGGAGEETVETGYAKVATIDAGGAVLRDQTMIVLETSPPEVVGELIGGILGVEFFERFVTGIDYEKNLITFEDPRRFDSAERKAAGVLVRFKLYEHMPQVAGRFDDLPALYDVDTGSAQFVDMTRPFVERTALRARYPNAVTIVSGFGTGGASHSTIIRTKSLKLGPLEVARVPANLSTAQHGAFSDPVYDGNVGNGVLRHFRVTFDYPHQTMYLARVAHPDLSAYGFNRTGITLVLDHGRAKVVDVAANTPGGNADIKPGDFVLSIGELDVTPHFFSQAKQALRRVPVGEPLPLVYTRDGVQKTVTIIPRDLVPE